MQLLMRTNGLKTGAVKPHHGEARVLPYRKRLRKILREDYWRIFPEEKEEYLKNIEPDEVARLVNLIKKQPTR